MARPRLVDRVEATPPGGACVVVAGPGFGKTTLLAEWARHASGHASGHVGWVTVDAADNDRARLWAYVRAALQPALPESLASRLLRTPDPSTLVRLLVDEALPRLRAPVWLVLDDVHLLTDEAVWRDLALVLARLPVTTRAVLAGRHDPPLPLGRLRAAGRVTVVREAQLRFDAEDTRRILDAAGLAVPEPDVASLCERTEGWPAGIVLAAGSARDAADPLASLAGLRGHDRSVADFLLEEAFDLEPPEVQRFLLETCWLDLLTSSLCDAVTQRPGSAAVLAELERRHAFVTRQEGRDEPAFRYHALFAEVLRVQLELAHPGLGPELQRRAARWHEAAGDVSRAVRAYLAAGDQASALVLVERHESEYFVQGRASTLLEWYGMLGGDSEQRLLRVAWGSLFSGNDAAARAALAAGRAEAARRRASAAEVDLLDAELDLLAAQLAFLDADLVATEALARRAAEGYERCRATGTHARVTAALLVGRARLLQGDPAAASAVVRDALADPGMLPVLGRALRGLDALALAVEGDVAGAADLAGEVLREDVASGDPTLAVFDALQARAIAHRLSGRLDLALADLAELEATLSWPPPRPAMRRLLEVERAATLLAAGRPEAAGAELDASGPVPGSPLGEWEAAVVESAVRECLTGRSGVEALSQRELEVLGMLPSRLSLQEVAAALYVSPNTLKTHLKRVYAKLQVTAREDAVAKATALRILPPEATSPSSAAPPGGSSRPT